MRHTTSERLVRIRGSLANRTARARLLERTTRLPARRTERSLGTKTNAARHFDGPPTWAQTPADGWSRALLCAHIGGRVATERHTVPYSMSFVSIGTP